MPGSHDMEILVVCTANRCRSPMGEAFLTRALHAVGAQAHVTSAGTRAGGGGPVMAEVVDLLARQGISLGTGLEAALETEGGRRLEPHLVTAADLVLGMAREHVRDAVTMAPDSWPRTFTLKELVRRGAATGGRKPGEALPAWLARVAAGRRTSDLLGDSPDDDVADPVGMGFSAFEESAGEIDALTRRLATLLMSANPDANP